MAETRGGYRAPDGKPRPPAGPGRFTERTDLSDPRGTPQGAYAPSGLPYGDRQKVEQAQRNAPAPNRRARAGGRAPAVAPGRLAPSFDDMMTRPTRYPDEPVTAGLPVGAGVGPEVLNPLPGGSLAGLLAQIAEQSGVDDLHALAQRAQELGQ